MTVRSLLDQVARAMSAPALPSDPRLDVPCTGVVYDSRRATPGSVFVALAGQHADGVNVRLSSPHAAKYLAAARESAAEHQPNVAFDSNGWASFGDDASIAKAHELELDRLILASLERFPAN